VKPCAGGDQLLIFLHLPKTAGSTLAKVIRRQYGANSCLELYGSSSGQEITVLPGKEFSQVRVVIGHFHFGVHRFLSSPANYLTVLRDPVERVISHYYYVRRSPEHYLHPIASRLSLGDYSAACGLAEPNNDQTRMLTGEHPEANSGVCTPEMLPAALEHLRIFFPVVGITEDFDRSLLLIKRAYGWRLPLYTRENVSRRPRRSSIPPGEIRTIVAHNQLDCTLYAHALQSFSDQVRAQGPDFERELAAFRRLNALYSVFWQTAYRARRQRLG
jgi:hypothetical protein